MPLYQFNSGEFVAIIEKGNDIYVGLGDTPEEAKENATLIPSDASYNSSAALHWFFEACSPISVADGGWDLAELSPA